MTTVEELIQMKYAIAFCHAEKLWNAMERLAQHLPVLKTDVKRLFANR